MVIAPAFPDAGRVTVNGIQYVNKIAVDLSSYADDPVHPATTSRIADLIPAEIKNVTILNAESQQDLNVQVAAISSPKDVFWVGSPGLAQALAEVVGSKASSAKPAPFAKHVLIVVGSANNASRAQARRAQEAAFATCIVAPDTRTDDPKGVLATVVTEAISALIATGGDTMQAILEKLQIRSFELIGSFDAGFPMGRTTMEDGRSLILGKKAGGFGDVTTLYAAAVRLSQTTTLEME